ncbi:hypothetical protein GCM10009527_042360 [Actinomadura nitritigenes]
MPCPGGARACRRVKRRALFLVTTRGVLNARTSLSERKQRRLSRAWASRPRVSNPTPSGAPLAGLARLDRGSALSARGSAGAGQEMDFLRMSLLAGRGQQCGKRIERDPE